MSWTAAQMKPMLCRRGEHKPGPKLLYAPWDGPWVWECECIRCGLKWTEPAS